MNDLTISQSTQFEIIDLSIVTKANKLSIQGIFQEINIFDSVLNPCMSGTILIQDATNMVSNFLFDGSESLNIKIGKDKDTISIDKSFRIYKMSDRKNDNMTSQSYVLHFISDEMVLSKQQKVSQFFQTKYAQTAVQILNQYLKVPYTKMYGTFDDSIGTKDILIPNLNPIDAILWLAQRAIDKKKVPGFLFFENKLGYNFASISSLFEQQPAFNINFDPKNIDSTNNDLLGARSFEVVQDYDLLKNIQNGVYSGQFVGFDTVSRTIVRRNFSFGDHYDLYKHMNPGPNAGATVNALGYNIEQTESCVYYHPFSSTMADIPLIRQNDPASLSKLLDTENYIYQRKAIMNNIFGKKVKLVMPGNFAISSGFVVGLTVPTYGIKDRTDDNLDTSLHGNYMLSAVRHIITYNKHETIVEAVTDSSNKTNSGAMIKASNKQATLT